MVQGEVLPRRALNRATLARQALLARAELRAPAMLERLVGLQAQAPQPPYVGLWSRVAGFRGEEVSGLLQDRSAVRMTVMRGTVHLVTAADARLLRPLAQPEIERQLLANHGSHLTGVDRQELVAASLALLADGPLTPAELAAGLTRRWPVDDPNALARAALAWTPMVQVPPRALFGRSGAPRHTPLDDWLGGPGEPVDAGRALEDVVLRYLGGFGPATGADVRKWLGGSTLAPVLQRLRPRLVTFRDEAGRELFDLPDAPRPGPDASAPVRFVPDFDNLLIGYADGSRVLYREHRPHVFTVNGQIRGVVLVDGFAVATWKVERKAGVATLRVQPFAALPSRQARAVETEGGRLLDFLDTAPDAARRSWTRAVTFDRP